MVGMIAGSGGARKPRVLWIASRRSRRFLEPIRVARPMLSSAPLANGSLNNLEDRMRIRLMSVTVCTGLVVAGLVGGLALRNEGQAAQAAAGAPAAQAPAPVAPPDTAALRAQYEK